MVQAVNGKICEYESLIYEAGGAYVIFPYDIRKEERISWSMPTYWKGHNIIHFAGFMKHAGLYPGPEAVQKFSGRLKEYKTSKGTIQLPYSRSVPVELISDIARWCYETGNHP